VTPRRRDGDGGFLTIQYVTAAALSLVLLTLVVNAIVFGYARSVARTAVADGARSGARTGSSVVCRDTASDVVADLLGPSLADGMSFDCDREADVSIARARVVLRPWLPGLPTWRFTVEASVPNEELP
jgi:hypothetical protein